MQDNFTLHLQVYVLVRHRKTSTHHEGLYGWNTR